MKQEHIGVLIKMASLAFDRTATQLLSDFELTPSQFKILKYLSLNSDKAVRQIDIETFFRMSNPTVTGILQNLEKKGMVKRKHHPDDKRCKLIVLSDSAALQASDYLKTSREIEDVFTKQLTASQKETLKNMLTTLIEDNQKDKETNHESQ